MKCYSSEEQAADSSWREAELACRKTFITSTPPEGWCPGTFDGWSCWNHTPPNTTATTVCPSLIGEELSTVSATKYCRPGGTWWTTETGIEWANYTACFDDTSFYDYHRSLSIVLYVGYSLSIGACFLALLVHHFCKTLNCGRTKIHQNLFASYVLSCLTQLIWLRVQENVQALVQNPVWCRLLHVLATYFLLSNYAWMFCEGLYLYCILKITFLKERRLLIAACIIGWVIPLVPTIIYVILRVECVQHARQLQNCWTVLIPNLWWSYASFSLACQICNFLFLVTILRMVYIKSTDPSSSNQSGGSLNKIIAVFRAFVILVPLLGVQYLLSCFRPSGSHHLITTVYEICYSACTSLQGFAVAALFCFSNSEVFAGGTLQVKKAISRKWVYWKLSRPGHSMITNSLATAAANTPGCGSFSVAGQPRFPRRSKDAQSSEPLITMTDVKPTYFQSYSPK